MPRIPYGQYVRPAPAANVAAAEQLAFRGVESFKQSQQFDRSQTELERVNEERENLAREELELAQARLEEKKRSDEAWRQLQANMQQRGIEAKEAQFARQQEAQAEQQVRGLQDEYMMLLQDPNPQAQARAAAVRGMLGMMGIEAYPEGMAPVEEQPQELLPAAAGMEEVPPSPPPQEPPAAVPLPGVFDAMPPIETAPPPQAPAPFEPQAAPLGASPSYPIPMPEEVPPVEMPQAAQPGVRFVDTRTGEEYFTELVPAQMRVHPVDVIHDQIDEFITKDPAMNRAMHAAADMSREVYAGDTEEDVEKWWDRTREFAKVLSKSEADARPRGRGGRAGRAGGMGQASVSQALSAQRAEDAVTNKIIRDFEVPESRAIIAEISTIEGLLDEGTFKSVDAAATMIATSLQSGVLSNQDKAPYIKLPGIVGDVKGWLDANAEMFGSSSAKVPPAQIKELRDMIKHMDGAARHRVDRGYDAAYREYRQQGARMARALTLGYTNEAEIARLRRDQVAGTIRVHFHPDHWRNVPGIDEESSPRPDKEVSLDDYDRLVGE